MTTDLHQLHPTRDFLEPPPERLSRAWVALAALGLAVGAGVTTWALAGSEPEPDPAPPSTAALAAAAAEDDAKNDAPAADDGFEDESDVMDNAIEAAHEAAEKSAPLEPATDGKYFVQVASYKDPLDAKNVAEGLVGLGLPAERVTDPGSQWNKIRLGPYETRADAEKARFKLGVNQRRDAYVMPRSNGKFHVQVGSFAERKDAEPLAKRLGDKGHVTKISRIKMGDKRWHCVRIGPFDTYDEASGYLELVDVPGSKARVIPFAPEE